MTTNSDENAFPVMQGETFQPREWGLTKRELFAAMAMQGLCSDPDYPTGYAVTEGVKLADALIAELNKEKK